MFEKIIAGLNPAADVTKLTPLEIAQLMEEVPGLPQVYLDFMKVVGYGDIGGVMIYSGPIDSHDFFGDLIPPSTSVMLVGDNLCGSYFGFDMDNGGELVEILSEIWEAEPVKEGFEEFIARYQA